MAKLKVYGGLVHMRGGRGQVRTIVATTSQKKAAELVGCTISEIRDWWETTENDKELATALAQPGVVLQADDSMGNGEFVPMTRTN